jgi:hypothetical protein
MMMPNSSIQRDLTHARRTRFERTGGHQRIGADARPNGRSRLVSLRVQVGHALIGAGSWLSGERVEGARPSAHRPA